MTMRSVCVFAFCAAFAASAWTQNTNNENDLELQNGTDIIYYLNAPSVGSPQGTNPPSFVGDFYWKVFPKEVMSIGSAAQTAPASPANAAGTMEVSGQAFEIYDSDWTTPAILYDQMITRGITSTAAGSQGNIQPDFTDPNAVVIFLNGPGPGGPGTGNSGLPAPPGGCPPGGGLNGYIIDVQFGTGVGDGIIVTADGQTDLVLTSFFPGGMSLVGGACAGGDFSFENAQSSNAQSGYPEQQADWLLSGNSAYSGYHPAGFGNIPDVRQETPRQTLQFFESTLTGRVNVGNGNAANPETGLAALNVSTASGLVQYGFRVYSRQSVGNFAIVAFGAYNPGTNPLAPPGLQPVFGFPLMLDPQDPLFTFSLNLPGFAGAVGLVGTGQTANGIFDTTLVPIPAFPASIQIVAQAAIIGAGGSVTLTNTFVSSFRP